MKVSVNVLSGDVKRLYKSGVKGKTYNQADLVDMLYAIYDRLERDYPNAMKPVQEGVNRRYTSFLSKCMRERVKAQSKQIDELYGNS